jgi:hypothetical protein
VSKEFRNAYVERVVKRDRVVAALLESHFTAEFREGLSTWETALPLDLIVHPPVRGLTLFYDVNYILRRLHCLLYGHDWKQCIAVQCNISSWRQCHLLWQIKFLVSCQFTVNYVIVIQAEAYEAPVSH